MHGQTTKRDCPSCGGSGHIQFFQGESRFLLTVEECPECCGTGYLLLEREPARHATEKKSDQERIEK